MHNTKKVGRYYNKFQEAAQAVEDYIDEVGGCLADEGYIAEASEFRETLEQKTDAREAARLQLERVVREEQLGIGPITVSNRVTVTYDGKYLYDNLPEDVRDQCVEVVYKVKTAEFKKLTADGTITSDQVNEAILNRKESVALKGVPAKIGLA